jgi:hypothetical protein
MKTCLKCGIEKPVTEFHADSSRKTGLRENCKDCRCKHPKQLTKNCLACNDLFVVSGKGKARIYCGNDCQFLHLRYGISEYKYEDLLLSQDYKCAICRQPESVEDKRTGKVYPLAVDHCHKTGQVRALL